MDKQFNEILTNWKSHKNEIENYVSMEHADHSTNKLTKVSLIGGVIIRGHLFARNQDINLKSENKWVFIASSGDRMVLDGNNIISLKVS